MNDRNKILILKDLHVLIFMIFFTEMLRLRLCRMFENESI